jgi:hypothetical protein
VDEAAVMLAEVQELQEQVAQADVDKEIVQELAV